MPRLRTLATLALTAALAMGLATGLAACAEDPPPEPMPSAVAKKLTPSPSPSPSLTADELDLKAAEAVVLAYRALLSDLQRNPDATRVNEGDLLARDRGIDLFQANISPYLSGERLLVGEIKVEIVDSVKDADGTWVVDACVDVTGTDALDQEGKSVVPSDRQNRKLSHYTVSKDLKDLKFYVVDWTNEGREPC